METRIRVRGAPRQPWWRSEVTALCLVLFLVVMGALLGRRPSPAPPDADDPAQRLEALRLEARDLRTQQLLLEEGLREGERLRLLAVLAHELTDKGLSFVAATASPGRGTHILLGRGEKSEIGPRDVVIAPEGLVGRIASVGTYTSEAALLTDRSVGVAVRIVPADGPGGTAEPNTDNAADEPSDIRGIVTGGRMDGLLTLSYLSSESGLIRGDRVVTSGMGGVYPKDLPVGIVEDEPVVRPGRPAEATVRPFGEWARLREVLIVRRPADAGSRAQASGPSS